MNNERYNVVDINYGEILCQGNETSANDLLSRYSMPSPGLVGGRAIRKASAATNVAWKYSYHAHIWRLQNESAGTEQNAIPS